MNSPQETLTELEQSKLAQCERTISKGLAQFVDVGNALLEIRDQRLYRAEYKNFDSYCRAKWGWSYQRSNQYIASANVAKTLTTAGCESVPASERQARELSTLPPDKQPEAWSRANEMAAKENRPVETHDVREAAKAVTEPPRKTYDAEFVEAMGGVKSVEEFTAPSNALDLGRYNGCKGRMAEIEETAPLINDTKLIDDLYHQANGLAAFLRQLKTKRTQAAA